jgi:hypothetical protein
MASSAPVYSIDWGSLIPPNQWETYRSVLDRLQTAGIQFALGGGLAVGLYTGNPRNTKDLDFYIKPDDREAVISIMTDCGLTDYYETLPYDRAWIYRGNREDVIVDAIWAMANKRANVDKSWLSRGTMIRIFDKQVRILAPEELIWSKLYVMQRDRCDWPDVLNLLSATGSHLDWSHLLKQVAEDKPLLRGVLSIFSWVSPEQAMSIHRRVWSSLGLSFPTPAHDPEGRPSRPALLDSRPWFCGRTSHGLAASLQ